MSSKKKLEKYKEIISNAMCRANTYSKSITKISGITHTDTGQKFFVLTREQLEMLGVKLE